MIYLILSFNYRYFLRLSLCVFQIFLLAEFLSSAALSDSSVLPRANMALIHLLKITYFLILCNLIFLCLVHFSVAEH